MRNQRVETISIFEKSSLKIPEISIVMPVFNQESIVPLVIENLIRSMALTFEIIIIDDASEDASLTKILETCSREFAYQCPNFLSYSVYQNTKSKFETYCDTFGFSKSNGKFLLEVQSDMIINDYGFDKRLVQAMNQFPELFALSGRGTEPMEIIAKDYLEYHQKFNFRVIQILGSMLRRFKLAMNPISDAPDEPSFSSSTEVENEEVFLERENFGTTGRAGRLGNDLFKAPRLQDIQKRLIYFGDTVMRGPLLIRRDMYLQIGGLDADTFFLGYDDHDLFCRGIIKKNWRVAYSPVLFCSPIGMGSTRKSRSFRQQVAFLREEIRVHRNYKNSILYSLGVNSTPWKNLHWISRKF
jgi:glycosyltransferase involved in cell wall biosynthesis